MKKFIQAKINETSFIEAIPNTNYDPEVITIKDEPLENGPPLDSSPGSNLDIVNNNEIHLRENGRYSNNKEIISNNHSKSSKNPSPSHVTEYEYNLLIQENGHNGYRKEKNNNYIHIHGSSFTRNQEKIMKNNNTSNIYNESNKPLNTNYNESYVQPRNSFQSQEQDNTTNGYYDNSSDIQNSYSYTNQDSSSYMYNDVYTTTQGHLSNNIDQTHIYQEPSTSTNGYIYNQSYNYDHSFQRHYSGYILSPPPPPPPPEEPETDIPQTSSYSTSSSSNNGLDNFLKSMPSTSNGTTSFTDILNSLSQSVSTSNSSNQEWIKNMQQSISQNQSQPCDSSPYEYFTKKCNKCEFRGFRLQYKMEKVQEMRLTNEELNKKIALLDKRTEKINNAILAFGKRTKPSTAQNQFSGPIASQDVRKEKIAEYLKCIFYENEESTHGEIP